MGWQQKPILIAVAFHASSGMESKLSLFKTLRSDIAVADRILAHWGWRQVGERKDDGINKVNPHNSHQDVSK